MLRKAELTGPFAAIRSSIVIVLLAALVLATAGLFTTSVSVLLLVYAGLLFGVFLNGISRWVADRSPLSYLVSYLSVTGLMFVGAAAGLFYLGAQVGRRADELSAQLQAGVQQLGNTLSQYEWANQLVPESMDWQAFSVEKAPAILPSLFSGLQWATWGMTGGLVILFVGLYAAYNPDLYRDGLVKLFPKDRRQRTDEVLDYLNAALARWILGRFFSMAIVGVMTAIGLWILGVPLPITLGVVAALLTFIPNVGPILAAVPQSLLALNVSPQTALYVLGLNLVLQGIESYLITPMIQRHEVTLPPILTIAAQLLMGVLFGIIGIMMAAPLVVVALVLVQLLYIHDRLGDEDPGKLTRQIG